MNLFSTHSLAKYLTAEDLRVTLGRIMLGYFALTGIALALITHPFQIADEDVHWQAAQKRMGQSCGLAQALPDHFEARRMPHQSEQKMHWGAFSTLSQLTPKCSDQDVSYASALTYPAVWVARVLTGWRSHAPWLEVTYFYLSRLLAGMLTLALLLRLFRTGSWIALPLLFFCSSPVFIQQSFAISPDAILHAFALSLATLILDFPKASTRFLLVTGLLGTIAVLTKPILAPLIATLGLLPLWNGWRQGKARTQTLWAGGLTLLAVIRGLTLSASVTNAAQAPQQKAFLFEHPMTAISIILSGVFEHLKPFQLTQHIGWHDIALPIQLTYLWSAIMALLLVTLFIGLKLEVTTKRIVAFLLTLAGALASMSMISAIMFLAETPLGHPTVYALQGRYFFFHVIVLMALACHLFTRQPSHSIRVPRLTPIVSVVYFVFAGFKILLSVFHRYS